VSKTRRLLTNFSKGELSPLLEGRSDLAAYFEGGKTIENWKIMRQGGLRRWEGTRFVKEVKDSSKDTILWPFEFSVDDSYILEVGDLYLRVYKNKAPVLNGGVHVEVVTPFLVADIRAIHMTQSADVLFLFHSSYQQRKLSRVSDTNWALSLTVSTPPPSFEADTDIAGGTATLTPGATTGEGVTFTASAAVFLAADDGRQIIFGASRAVITAFTDTSHVVADILDAFPDTNPIAAGLWLLRLSPQTTLDPNKKGPVGAQATLVAALGAFRTADVGKFIAIYGGIIKITKRTSVTSISGTILSLLSESTTADPPAAAAGNWTLEDASWSTARGWPRTGEFFQGRLYQASTASQPVTFWGSRADNYDNNAVGITAEDAVEYTIASRQVNRLEWIIENNKALFIGTNGSEQKASGSGADNALIGGDTIPGVDRLATNGCMPIQPIMARKSILYIDRSRRKVLLMGFDLESDGETDKEISVGAEHITTSGVRLGALALEKRLDPRLYFDREDGTLVSMTFFPEQKVVAFSRRVTAGTFESRAVIPTAGGGDDQVWVVAKRTINGQTKRFVECFEPMHEDLAARNWPSLQTDCALVLTGVTGTSLTGLSHLEGATVDVVKNNSFIGQFVVTTGAVTLAEALVAGDVCEVGLHYESTAVTMRPAIEGAVIEGLPRSWDSLFVRVKDTKGGTVNGEALVYAPSDLDENDLYTGDKKVTGQGWDSEGRITIAQPQPYPMTVLATFGTLSIGEHD